jgi:hypothetical protein
MSVQKTNNQMKLDRMIAERDKAIQKVTVAKVSLASISNRPIPETLTPGDLPLPIDFVIRKLVADTYNHLKKTEQLDLLNKPENEIYIYRGGHDHTAHPAIQDLAKKTYDTQYNYHAVWRYAAALGKGNLGDLERVAYNQELQKCKYHLKFCVEEIENEQARQSHLAKTSNKAVKDFSPGDFSFIADTSSRNMLAQAYCILTQENAWSGFNYVTKPKEGFQFIDDCMKDGKMSKAMSIIGEKGGHSGFSMMWTMNNLYHLHTNGWEATVKMWLDKQRQKEK